MVSYEPAEGLIIDEALDMLNELTSKAPRSKDREEHKKGREEFQATTMTKYATFLEAMVDLDSSPSPVLLTWS
jgi:hypothetical protein